MSEAATYATIETIARVSYGRLIAYLAARSGDIAGAEDALAEAFVTALKKWPADGIPQKPEAWLLHVARNRIIDAARHNQVRQNSETFLQQIAEEAEAIADTQEQFPDERLKLLFVCAHPAIDPAAMSQRLVRTKGKIRDAGIPFCVPEPAEWNDRVGFVLDAIYSVYTTGWESLMETGSTHHALAVEAIAIGRTLVELIPDEPEAHGLLALMLHCQARSPARYNSDGDFVPLDKQDTAQWLHPMIEEAEKHLRTAATFKRLGRYQLEAAIQSIHANRAKTGRTDWHEIALLYEGLTRIAPGIGALVGRAVALAESGKPEAGLTALDGISEDRAPTINPIGLREGICYDD